MATANTRSNASAQNLIDQRLDVIDGALIGLLPRCDRLAMVAGVETRIRELAAARADAAVSQQTASESPGELVHSGLPAGGLSAIPESFGPAFGGMNWQAGRKRSRLALSAAVLGMVALVLLFATPVTYVIVGTVGDFLGEIVALSLLGLQVAMATLGGAAAVGLGVAALVHLKRRKGSLTGQGWAIAGLCTGPLAMFVGGLALIVGGLEVLESQNYNVQAAMASAPASNMVPPPASNADAVPPSNVPDAYGSPVEIQLERYYATTRASQPEPEPQPEAGQRPVAEPPASENEPVPETVPKPCGPETVPLYAR